MPHLLLALPWPLFGRYPSLTHNSFIFIDRNGLVAFQIRLLSIFNPFHDSMQNPSDSISVSLPTSGGWSTTDVEARWHSEISGREAYSIRTSARSQKCHLGEMASTQIFIVSFHEVKLFCHEGQLGSAVTVGRNSCQSLKRSSIAQSPLPYRAISCP